MKTRVIGWVNHKNIGDESYKLSFPTVFKDQNFHFGDAVNLNEPSDAVVLGGGDIFNETYVSRVLRIPTKRRLAISVSANSNTPIHLLDRFDQIFVRDQRSVDFLTGHNVPCTYMPDVSTSLSGNAQLGKEYLRKAFADEGLELYQKVVGVVFNAHLFPGKSDMYARDFLTFNYVSSQLGKVIDDTSASFVFFPMSTGMPHDDRITNSYLANRCKFWKKNCLIYDRLSVQETMNLVAGCDAVISSRLHTSIFCLNSNVPFIDVTHHDKNRSFLESQGLEDCSVSYWNFDMEKTKSLLSSMLNGNDYRARLQHIHQRQIEVLERESKNVHFV